jgi:hypothetical protein
LFEFKVEMTEVIQAGDVRIVDLVIMAIAEVGEVIQIENLILAGTTMAILSQDLTVVMIVIAPTELRIMIVTHQETALVIAAMNLEDIGQEAGIIGQVQAVVLTMTTENLRVQMKSLITAGVSQLH